MSVAFTPSSREVKNGKVIVRGTVTFTTSALAGESVSPEDIESGLGAINVLRIAASGATSFTVVHNRRDLVTIKPIEPSTDLTVVSFSTASPLAFVCVGEMT